MAANLPERVAAAVADTCQEGGGDILVFLPGMREIVACESTLRPLARPHGLDLVRVHGSLPTDRVADALGQSGTRRRVFLATNVAETSLTIPGVTVVVDSGLARMRTHRAGRASLVLTGISLAAMEQRRGRAGRVAPGRCIRLWAAQHQPPASTPPEVCRIELDDLMLAAGDGGLDGDRFDAAPWPTPPPEFAVANSRARLQALGALDRHHHITRFGRRLAELPVSAHEARMLVDAPGGLAPALCDLVALLQTRGDLLRGRGDAPDATATGFDRQHLLQGVSDEVTANLRLLRNGNATKHGLNPTALQDARRIATALRGLLGCDTGDPTGDPEPLPPRDALADFLLHRCPEAAFVLRARALRKTKTKQGSRPAPKGEPWGNGSVEITVHPHPLWKEERAAGRWPLAGLILDHEWIGAAGTGVQGVGRLLLPCSYSQLAAAGLGTDEVGAVRLERTGGTRLVGTVNRVHAGVTISTEEATLRSKPLREAAAALILEGRLLADSGERIADALHLAQILSQWPEAAEITRRPAPGALPTDPLNYLVGRLDTLGVEESEDLELITTDDLLPDLAALFGMAEFQLDPYRRDFPRVWNHNGAPYRCEIDPKLRQVTLLPADRRAGKAPPPDPWALPGFRGFKVRYRKASRTLHLRT